MIISHRHRFVFCKTRKSAGTSIELALSTVCGPDDVLTPLVAADEARRAQLPGPGAQHYLFPRRRYTPRDWAVLAVRRRQRALFHHAPASAAVQLIGRRRWESYFRFAVERNPWDAVVSQYYYRHQDEATRPRFSEFLRSPAISTLADNWSIYSLGDRPSVDLVCRYDNLSADFARACASIGIATPELPRAKSAFRSGGRDYTAMYSPADRDLVARAFARQIDAFGFTFGDDSAPRSDTT